jgi:spore coat assembly protein
MRMSNLKVGDIVARKSYGEDVFFKVTGIRSDGQNSLVTLKGITYRLEADAPENDLVIQSDSKVKEYRNKCCMAAEKKTRAFQSYWARQNLKKGYYRNTSKELPGKYARPGKVLHIDGDKDYLETCLNEYRKLAMDIAGEYVPEKNQPVEVYSLLKKHKPDILILTGHDGIIKSNSNYGDIDNYRNSKYFIDAVKEARRYDGDFNGLFIFAGACQSMYKEIIKAGANFASSPNRILIHALDPVHVCRKVAFTSINKVLSPKDIINDTITGSEGIGGMETWGKYRDGFPLEPYNN